jgi:hypothetical protein
VTWRIANVKEPDLKLRKDSSRKTEAELKRLFDGGDIAAKQLVYKYIDLQMTVLRLHRTRRVSSVSKLLSTIFRPKPILIRRSVKSQYT